MSDKIKKQKYYSNSSWIHTKVVWYVRDNSGKVTAKDVVDVVGRGGVIDSKRVMHELCALESDGSIRLHEQNYEYIGRRRV